MMTFEQYQHNRFAGIHNCNITGPQEPDLADVQMEFFNWGTMPKNNDDSIYISPYSGVIKMEESQSQELTPDDVGEVDAVMQAGSRELTGHIVNAANDRLRIVVCDQPGQGGACHRYVIEGYDESTNVSAAIDQKLHSPFTEILFQNGPIDEDGNGINGITHEALLAILIDRMEGFQAGKYACDENGYALDHLKLAQGALHSRTKDRMNKGIEGTHAVDAEPRLPEDIAATGPASEVQSFGREIPSE